MKVFLYERVSSEEQVKHGYSLDAQHDALIEFCDRHNHVILGTYKDEGISGRKPYSKRPAMVQLLTDLEVVKPDMILFTKLDRWFRNIKEYYKVQDILDRYKVDWKAINEEYDTSTASGRLYVNIKLSIAQDEADRTAERIRDVNEQRILQGKYLSNRVPHGYKLENGHVVFGEKINETKDLIKYFLSFHSTSETIRYIYAKYGKLYKVKLNLSRLIGLCLHSSIFFFQLSSGEFTASRPTVISALLFTSFQSSSDGNSVSAISKSLNSLIKALISIAAMIFTSFKILKNAKILTNFNFIHHPVTRKRNTHRNKIINMSILKAVS